MCSLAKKNGLNDNPLRTLTGVLGVKGIQEHSHVNLPRNESPMLKLHGSVHS